MWLRIRNVWRWWRLRPGLLVAARDAESLAWSNKNTRFLGPEKNLIDFAEHLRRIAD
jgi:hypothetical protein